MQEKSILAITKICKKCGEDKPLAKFNISKQMPSGRQHICRKCSVSPEAVKRAEQNKYKNHKDKILERNKQYREKNRDKRLDYSRSYYEQNKEKLLSDGKIRYQLKKEAITVRNKRYWETRMEEDPLFLKQWAAAYRDKNRDKINLMKSDHRKDNRQRYRELSKVYRARRRATEYNADGDFSNEQWFELLELCENKCACCGNDSERLTVDHIIPFIMGGTNYIWNVQPLCITCNCEKARKAIDFRNKEIRLKFDEYNQSDNPRTAQARKVARENGWASGCSDIP